MDIRFVLSTSKLALDNFTTSLTHLSNVLKISAIFFKNCQKWLEFGKPCKIDIKFEFSDSKLVKDDFTKSFALLDNVLNISAISPKI